jgi:hypothetical protein
MKSKLFLFAVLCSLTASSFAQKKTAELTINFSFMGIEKGYDHPFKLLVYVDEVLVGTSEVAPESKPSAIKIKVPKGTHKLYVEGHALYEGVWEAHLMENNYSIDCTFTGDQSFKKKHTLHLVFDLDCCTKATFK